MTRNAFKFLGLLLIVSQLVLTGGCIRPTVCWERRPMPALFARRRSMAIPDRYPVGSVVRSHYHTMEANAEASDFVINRCEFRSDSAELTPSGRDRVMEIAARMRSAPFPVLVERSINNSDPELDQHRLRIVTQILTDHGNPDAAQRTFVSTPYSKGINSLEGEVDYFRFTFSRGDNGNGNGGNNNGGNNGGGSF